MRTLYLECGMGAAGDMICAALFELIDDKRSFADKITSIFPDFISISFESAETCGILGTRMRVCIHGQEEHSHDTNHRPHERNEHHHEHRSLADIEEIIDSLDVSPRVKGDAKAVYMLIAEAESAVHGRSVSQVHFHELGAIDAVADVVTASMLFEQINPQRVIVSPVCVGKGYVKCAHGMLPVPAPATARLLQDIPIYAGDIESELCTPTGAALLKHFAGEFSSMPTMRVSCVGCGIGSKRFERANCVRSFLGEDGNPPESCRDSVAELRCNIDDMTGEAVSFAAQALLSGGALDVYTIPITMKKGRPAYMLCVICGRDDAEKLAHLMLKHTSTLGVRISFSERLVMERHTETRPVFGGNVRLKRAALGDIERSKLEYDDVAEFAKANDISYASAYNTIMDSLR